SGFTGSAGTLLVMADRAILWTDGRYYVQAEKELASTKIELYRMQEKGVPAIREFLRDVLAYGMCVGCDGRTISTSFYLELLKITEETGALIRSDIDLADRVWPERPPMTKNGVYFLDLSIAGSDTGTKLAQLRRLLAKKDADAYVLTELGSIMWLFNLRGSDIACNPVAFSYAYISQEQAILFLPEDGSEKETANVLLKFGVRIASYDEIEGFLLKLSGERLLCDPQMVNCRLYQCMKEKNRVLFGENTEMIEKAVKNDIEISHARKYHVIDAVSVLRFIIYIKEQVKTAHVTEYEAAKYLDALREKNEGFVGLSFETICAYKENAAIVHYSAKPEGSALLHPKGMLLVDSGGQYLGATTDITRTIVLGELTMEEKEHYTAVLKGLLHLADARFLEGCTGENLDILAREPIWRLGIDYRHGTGHGIGSFLNVHEGPQAFRFKINREHLQPPLQAGMITSDEPGIYIEGSHGIRLENELLCVKKEETEWGSFLGFETLTLVPFDLDAVLPKLMSEKEKILLNVYHANVFRTLCPHLTDSEKTWLAAHTHKI
ncbi:MAG TPA: aminopeptidase P family protein, partial [Lachnospiraceae bacterium]|nr:aminopeptidase P family protein [Lachnospiraceae bacterium]